MSKSKIEQVLRIATSATAAVITFPLIAGFLLFAFPNVRLAHSAPLEKGIIVLIAVISMSITLLLVDLHKTFLHKKSLLTLIINFVVGLALLFWLIGVFEKAATA